MSTPEQWLAERLAAAPPSLRTYLDSALAGHASDGNLSTVLHERAEHLLHEAQAGGADRSTAMKLLAADALITLACEHDATFDGAGETDGSDEDGR